MPLFGTPKYTIVRIKPVAGSKNMKTFLTKELFEVIGGGWGFETDPVKAAHMMIEHIDKKREQLKLMSMMYEPLTEKVSVGV